LTSPITMTSLPHLARLAGAIEEHPLSGGIQLTIIGMLVVFTALALILALLTTLKYFTNTGGAPSGAPTPSPSPKAVNFSNDPHEIDPRTMAILTAAVAVVVGQSARIRAVRVVRNTVGREWSGMGRSAVQATHHFRKES
jgi:Na+-transporting methylmalonyl-CoA/oxaloacetate decarboxylase gamma subunit